MVRSVIGAISNLKGGMAGVLIYCCITVCVFGIAFMAAFGNDTPSSRMILGFANLYFIVANPLWTIPLSFVCGGFIFYQDVKNSYHGADEQ